MSGHKHQTRKERGAVLTGFGISNSAPKGKTVQAILGPVLADDSGKFNLAPFQVPVNPIRWDDIVFSDGTTTFATIQGLSVLLVPMTNVLQIVYNATYVPNNWQTYIEYAPGTPTYVPEGPVLTLRYKTTGGIIFDSHQLGMKIFSCQSSSDFFSWNEDLSYFDRIDDMYLEWSGATWIPC